MLYESNNEKLHKVNQNKIPNLQRKPPTKTHIHIYTNQTDEEWKRIRKLKQRDPMSYCNTLSVRDMIGERYFTQTETKASLSYFHANFDMLTCWKGANKYLVQEIDSTHKINFWEWISSPLWKMVKLKKTLAEERAETLCRYRSPTHTSHILSADIFPSDCTQPKNRRSSKKVLALSKCAQQKRKNETVPNRTES